MLSPVGVKTTVSYEFIFEDSTHLRHTIMVDELPDNKIRVMYIITDLFVMGYMLDTVTNEDFIAVRPIALFDEPVIIGDNDELIERFLDAIAHYISEVKG